MNARYEPIHGEVVAVAVLNVRSKPENPTQREKPSIPPPMSCTHLHAVQDDRGSSPSQGQVIDRDDNYNGRTCRTQPHSLHPEVPFGFDVETFRPRRTLVNHPQAETTWSRFRQTRQAHMAISELTLMQQTRIKTTKNVEDVTSV